MSSHLKVPLIKELEPGRGHSTDARTRIRDDRTRLLIVLAKAEEPITGARAGQEAGVINAHLVLAPMRRRGLVTHHGYLVRHIGGRLLLWAITKKGRRLLETARQQASSPTQANEPER